MDDEMLDISVAINRAIFEQIGDDAQINTGVIILALVNVIATFIVLGVHDDVTPESAADNVCKLLRGAVHTSIELDGFGETKH